MAGIITAVASLALVLGALLAWVLSNERRISTLEKGQETHDEEFKRIDTKLDSVHERLDGYFAGHGRRGGP